MEVIFCFGVCRQYLLYGKTANIKRNTKPTTNFFCLKTKEISNHILRTTSQTVLSVRQHRKRKNIFNYICLKANKKEVIFCFGVCRRCFLYGKTANIKRPENKTANYIYPKTSKIQSIFCVFLRRQYLLYDKKKYAKKPRKHFVSEAGRLEFYSSSTIRVLRNT